MTISIEAIARKLARTRNVDQWLVRESRVDKTVRILGRSDFIADTRNHGFEVFIYRDRRATRGEASFYVGREEDGALEVRLKAAVEQAAGSSGPQWRLQRPAAPARVRIADPNLSSNREEAITSIAATLADTRRNKSRVSTANISISWINKRIRDSNGFDHEHTASEVDVAGTLELGDRSFASSGTFARRRRRLVDLDLEAHLQNQLESLSLISEATKLRPGVYDLVFAADALRPRRGIDNWLRPIAAQAGGEMIRRGLSRFVVGQQIVSDDGGDSIVIESDGTIDFARESAPLDEWGGPIRRFPLIKNGRAVALALVGRDAALRGEPGNGGARNLALQPGERSFENLTEGNRQRLVVTQLDHLSVDEFSSVISGRVGLATSPGSSTAFTGGQFSFDLFDALGRARLSSETVRDREPAWIAIPNTRVS